MRFSERDEARRLAEKWRGWEDYIVYDVLVKLIGRIADGHARVVVGPPGFLAPVPPRGIEGEVLGRGGRRGGAASNEAAVWLRGRGDIVADVGECIRPSPERSEAAGGQR